MIKNVYCERSTWIQSQSPQYNYGRQQTRRIWSSATASRRGRMLVQFPNSLTSMTAQGYDTYKLTLSNIQHGDRATDVVSVAVYALTRDWDQGKRYGDDGRRNWEDRTSSPSRSWTVAGGDYDDLTTDYDQVSTSALIELDNVDDDIQFDISVFFPYWRKHANHGLIFKFNDQSLQNGRRRYRTRHTTSKLYSPKVVCSTSADIIKDGATQLYVGSDYDLYYYNYVNGVLRDVSSTSSVFDVSLVSLSGSQYVVIDSLSRSRVSTGIYKASSTASLSVQAFAYRQSVSARWQASGRLSAYFPAIYKKVRVVSLTTSNVESSDQLTFILANRKQHYKKDQVATFKPKLFKCSNVRDLQGDATKVFVSSSMFYRLVDYRTQKTLHDWHPVDYNDKQNFFKVDFSKLFRDDDTDKYQLVVQMKADIYGQTVRYGYSIFDNRMITVV